MSYWENRSAKRMAEYHYKPEHTAVMRRAYNNAIYSIEESITKIFNKVMLDGGLTEAETKRLLNEPIPYNYAQALAKTLDTITDPQIKRNVLNQVNSLAYRSRISRLEALRLETKLALAKVADIELSADTLVLTDVAEQAYYKALFDAQKHTKLGFDFAKIPDGRVTEILKNKWSGKHYSKRIWGNTSIIAGLLEEKLTTGLAAGKTYKEIAKDFESVSTLGQSAAQRLVHTEMTYVANAAEIESLKEMDAEKYRFVATLDLRTSTICREMDGEAIAIADSKTGKNLPPLHPWCRSTIVMVIDEEVLKTLERRARDPVTGETYLVPANMTYKEWYTKHVEGNLKVEAEEKKLRNMSGDKRQYNKYKKIYGNKVGASFAKFQEMKYNDIEQWDMFKADYRYVNKVAMHASLGNFTLTNRLIGGGHGQGNIDYLSANGIGFNIVKEYSNGVRIGNVPEHKDRLKRDGTGQSWFPAEWTSETIRNAGVYVNNKNKDVEDGVWVFATYEGVRVGIIKENGRIGTIVPDNSHQPGGDKID